MASIQQLQAQLQEERKARQNAEQQLEKKQLDLHLVNQKLMQLTDSLEQEVMDRTDHLAAALQQAQSASKAKSDFLAKMSHEIRTPMNAVLGMSRLAMATDLNEKQRYYLGTIHHSAETLLQVINDVLDFAKFESGEMVMEHQAFSLGALVSNLQEMTQPLKDNKAIDLNFSIDSKVPDTLIGDTGRLGQVLMNLLSNAIKFTPNGEVTLSIQKQKLGQDSVSLHFAVLDTGIGMSKQQMERVFDSFVQPDDSRAKLYGGTGLGLAISKNIVHLMQGQLKVSSALGKGSCFYFSLELPFIPEINQEPQHPSNDLKNKTLLLVSDDEQIRRELGQRLSRYQMQVTVADSAQTGVRKYREGSRFELVMIDYQLPGIDGITCASKLMQDYHISPQRIVLFTDGDEAPLREALKQRNVHLPHKLNQPAQAAHLFDLLLTATRFPLDNRHNDGEADRKNLAKLKGCHLLLVEDNCINQTLACDILTSHDMTVDLANDGLEALEKLNYNRYDGVLMDCQMPNLDGYAATRVIRNDKRFAELPIIAMTADVMQEDIQAAFDAGMNAHIAKPLVFEQMFATMAQWITPSLQEPAPADEFELLAQEAREAETASESLLSQ